ncbi:prepilin-type N-terminal cleavage/methylation domain-containing protein [Metasolibacillus sp. FSL K6-0083]|uniref:PulJ/GspJ family protein n=1 Tax=Metasolibacillus sp. FSL K6-0083 TaxID=2921416 RepID=UPI00315A2AE0
MRLLRNSKGFTLFEVLAVIVILAIVSMLSISLVTSATKQQIEQSTHNHDIKEISYALKVITKDFRKSDDFKDESDESMNPQIKSYKFILNDAEFATYRLEDNQIFRNSQIIATNIKDLSITSNSIQIESLNDQIVNTEINFREGSN